MPGLANSASPTSGLPTTLGAVVFFGRDAGVIAADGFELTGVDVPAAFEAVTKTSSVWSTSAEVAT